jgi:hypothetical protein
MPPPIIKAPKTKMAATVPKKYPVSATNTRPGGKTIELNRLALVSNGTNRLINRARKLSGKPGDFTPPDCGFDYHRVHRSQTQFT